MSAYETARAYETVTLLRREGAAVIELNRPETMNAWNTQLGLDLLDAVRSVSADESVRAVMITGAGRGFSSGADLKAGFDPTPEGHPDVLTVLRERYHPIITGIRRMEKPVLAAVNGPAVGIGCSLALASDLVVAAESAYFLLAFANIGLVADGGATITIPARVGMGAAAVLGLLAERLTAADALRLGLADRVVSDAELEATVTDLALKLASGPTRAYA